MDPEEPDNPYRRMEEGPVIVPLENDHENENENDDDDDEAECQDKEENNNDDEKGEDEEVGDKDESAQQQQQSSPSILSRVVTALMMCTNGFWTERQAKAIIFGEYLWTLFCIVSVPDDFGICITGNVAFLFLLWCNKQMRRNALEDHQKHLMATHLIPILFLILMSPLSYHNWLPLLQVESDTDTDPFKAMIVIAAATYFCPKSVSFWIGKRIFTNANGRQAKSLVLGQWILPILLVFPNLNEVYFDDDYFSSVAAGNGVLLFLLWLNKQARSDLNDQQKELLASELFPIMFFGLCADPCYLFTAMLIAFFVVIISLVIANKFQDEPQRIPWFCKMTSNTVKSNMVFWSSSLRDVEDERYLQVLKLVLAAILIYAIVVTVLWVGNTLTTDRQVYERNERNEKIEVRPIFVYTTDKQHGSSFASERPH